MTQVLYSERQIAIEGASVQHRHSIMPRVSNGYDPFLLFDHFACNDPLEGPLRGFCNTRTAASRP